jgi:hypothetical protein
MFTTLGDNLALIFFFLEFVHLFLILFNTKTINNLSSNMLPSNIRDKLPEGWLVYTSEVGSL